MSSKENELQSSEPMVTKIMPMVPFKVLETGIPFYQDEECTIRVPEATLSIIQALDPEDQIQELDIVPTTKTYKVGQYVTMSFDNKRLWEDCWFKDPKSGEVQRAWNIHVNFIGEVIDPAVVEEERAALEDLEKRVQEKIQEIAEANKNSEAVN